MPSIQPDHIDVVTITVPSITPRGIPILPDIQCPVIAVSTPSSKVISNVPIFKANITVGGSVVKPQIKTACGKTAVRQCNSVIGGYDSVSVYTANAKIKSTQIGSAITTVSSNVRSNAFKIPSVWSGASQGTGSGDNTDLNNIGTGNVSDIISVTKEVIYGKYYEPLIQIDASTANVVSSSFGLPPDLKIKGNQIYGSIAITKDTVFTINMSNGKKIIVELKVKMYETIFKGKA